MDMSPLPDPDPQETQEWLDALDGVLEYEGSQRAHYLLEKLIDKARLRAVPHATLSIEAKQMMNK